MSSPPQAASRRRLPPVSQTWLVLRAHRARLHQRAPRTRQKKCGRTTYASPTSRNGADQSLRQGESFRAETSEESGLAQVQSGVACCGEGVRPFMRVESVWPGTELPGAGGNLPNEEPSSARGAGRKIVAAGAPRHRLQRGACQKGAYQAKQQGFVGRELAAGAPRQAVARPRRGASGASSWRAARVLFPLGKFNMSEHPQRRASARIAPGRAWPPSLSSQLQSETPLLCATARTS